MATRDEIISEIIRLADENGGRAPGRRAFENATGIREGEWSGVYWARWGDAVAEAGLQPNQKRGKLPTDQVLRYFAEAMRHYGHFPTSLEIKMYSRERPDFPGHNTFYNHFQSQNALVTALSKWLRSNDGCADLVALLPEAITTPPKIKANQANGFVYLLKSGDYYKIGRSDEVERRVKEITVALPEKVTMVHSIRTDDPPGIEAYWHRRFADRRANGEWFRLTAADVRAFKRRRFQ